MAYYVTKNRQLLYKVNKQTKDSIFVADDFIKDEYNLSKDYIVERDDSVSLSKDAIMRKKLKKNDWKITRHVEQLALGIPTSLSNEEYKTLLLARQTLRDTIT